MKATFIRLIFPIKIGMLRIQSFNKWAGTKSPEENEKIT